MKIWVNSNSEYKKINLLKFDASVFSLLIVNIITIFFAVIQKWDLFTLVIIYWVQSVIIGIFNFIRILSLKDFSTEGVKINNQPAQATPATKIFSAFFFAFHYGFFHLAYLIFILNGALFASNHSISFDKWYFLFLFVNILIFFINHLFSFRYNKKNDEIKKQNIGTLMFKPYLRIIPMHVILILGGIISNSSQYIIIFLLLKTFADVIMHNIEHR